MLAVRLQQILRKSRASQGCSGKIKWYEGSSVRAYHRTDRGQPANQKVAETKTWGTKKRVGSRLTRTRPAITQPRSLAVSRPLETKPAHERHISDIWVLDVYALCSDWRNIPSKICVRMQFRKDFPRKRKYEGLIKRWPFLLIKYLSVIQRDWLNGLFGSQKGEHFTSDHLQRGASQWSVRPQEKPTIFAWQKKRDFKGTQDQKLNQNLTKTSNAHVLSESQIHALRCNASVIQFTKRKAVIEP
ncbi:hypothetical protein C8R44DRAFT_748054 [Mycena epipterygia]|nr:hypothetical protein C8R44DRAFT_748054 [Mycena epipterygia]